MLNIVCTLTHLILLIILYYKHYCYFKKKIFKQRIGGSVELSNKLLQPESSHTEFLTLKVPLKYCTTLPPRGKFHGDYTSNLTLHVVKIKIRKSILKVRNMREDSICSGNVNSNIYSGYQVYDLEQEYNVYALYIL